MEWAARYSGGIDTLIAQRVRVSSNRGRIGPVSYSNLSIGHKQKTGGISSLLVSFVLMLAGMK
jgi:hypothetical protein